MHILHDAKEIESIMKGLDNSSVVEVGPAYGLMYEVLNRRYDNVRYKAVDLECSCKLMRFCVVDRPNCELVDCNQITDEEEENDIFISFYAFTECDIEIQKKVFPQIHKTGKERSNIRVS